MDLQNGTMQVLGRKVFMHQNILQRRSTWVLKFKKTLPLTISLYIDLKRFFILTQTTFFTKRICRVKISQLFNLKLTAKFWCSLTHNFRKTDFQ